MENKPYIKEEMHNYGECIPMPLRMRAFSGEFRKNVSSHSVAALGERRAMKGKLVQPQAAAYSTRVIHYLCTSPGRPRRPERTPSPRRRCWGSDRAHSRPWWECSGRNARCSRRRRAAATGRSMPRSSGSQQHGRAGVKRWSRLWLGSGEIAPG